MASFKARIAQVRAMALRQGYRLEKPRRYDRLALDYGEFNLFDMLNGEQLVNTGGRQLDDVERFLLSAPRQQAALVARIASRVKAQVKPARRGGK
jgi:hypothetical protein